MINKKWIWRTCGFSLILIFPLIGACTIDFCNIGIFVNSSDHRISIRSYLDGKIVVEKSVASLPPGSRFEMEERSCGHQISPPFTEHYNDSVALVFNDTLRVLIYSRGVQLTIYREHNPMHPMAWTEAGTTRECAVYLEYEFTNWHFEQAVIYGR
ncbi:MAG TPA: hypothetical protein VLH61_09580 [Bacteroidales bacterium]|nr:hypothetical protein [Bacteroidales bacterium]